MGGGGNVVAVFFIETIITKRNRAVNVQAAGKEVGFSEVRHVFSPDRVEIAIPLWYDTISLENPANRH
jgi:hypothetical protein